MTSITLNGTLAVIVIDGADYHPSFFDVTVQEPLITFRYKDFYVRFLTPASECEWIDDSGTHTGTAQDIADAINAFKVAHASGPAWGAIVGTLTNQTDLATALSGKQATLTSGTTIKTINGQSVLGSGNISISGDGSAINKVTGEVITSDGSDTLPIANAYTHGTLALYRGTRLTKGVDWNDGLTSTTVTLILVPDIGDKFVADYEY